MFDLVSNQFNARFLFLLFFCKNRVKKIAMMWLQEQRNRPTNHSLDQRFERKQRGYKNKQYLLIPTIVKLLQSFVFFPKTTIKRFLWLLQRVDLFFGAFAIIRYLPLRAVDLNFLAFRSAFDDLCSSSTQTLMLEITPHSQFSLQTSLFRFRLLLESNVVFFSLATFQKHKRWWREWFCTVTRWKSSLS